MVENEYFKINSIDEFKQAYDMFKDKWDKDYTLESEIMDFNKGFRYVRYGRYGIYLDCTITLSVFTEIQSPVRNINNLNKLI